MSRPIIDMRSRPAFLHDFYGATPATPEYETAKWLNRRLGSKQDDHFVRTHTLDGFIEEIREVGIRHAVVVGRDTPDIKIPNEIIRDITAPHPELIGIASVNPQALDSRAIAEAVEEAVNTLGLRGINIEPGFGTPPIQADDPLLYPVYDACKQRGVPVFLMSGPTTPNLKYANPVAVGKVARAFPDLPIVCYHGFYPYVNEMIGVAFRYENVYVVPDMYIFLPGGSLYVEAANGFMKEQLLFGSSYPFRAMGQTLDDFLRLGLHEEVLDRVLYQNAKRLLRI
jgi:predicted TIM-barrel fold metal-dependent hydrolase